MVTYYLREMTQCNNTASETKYNIKQNPFT